MDCDLFAPLVRDTVAFGFPLNAIRRAPEASTRAAYSEG